MFNSALVNQIQYSRSQSFWGFTTKFGQIQDYCSEHCKLLDQKSGRI